MTFDLTGSLLIATPGIADPRFAHTLIYLCSHSAEGAFGLVVNRPVPGLGIGRVLDQLDLPEAADAPAGLKGHPVVAGGPVEPQRGFVLHGGLQDSAVEAADGQVLPDGLVLSASLEILRLIARGDAPEHWLLALGYSGWGAGQLEPELARNAWLTTGATRGLIFDPAPGDHQWRAALRSMGIDPITLSAVAGHA